MPLMLSIYLVVGCVAQAQVVPDLYHAFEFKTESGAPYAGRSLGEPSINALGGGAQAALRLMFRDQKSLSPALEVLTLGEEREYEERRLKTGRELGALVEQAERLKAEADRRRDTAGDEAAREAYAESAAADGRVEKKKVEYRAIFGLYRATGWAASVTLPVTACANRYVYRRYRGSITERHPFFAERVEAQSRALRDEELVACLDTHGRLTSAHVFDDERRIVAYSEIVGGRDEPVLLVLIRNSAHEVLERHRWWYEGVAVKRYTLHFRAKDGREIRLQTDFGN